MALSPLVSMTRTNPAAAMNTESTTPTATWCSITRTKVGHDTSSSPDTPRHAHQSRTMARPEGESRSARAPWKGHQRGVRREPFGLFSL
eukprot:1177197-Prorocentrum_minimum.AAC.1